MNVKRSLRTKLIFQYMVIVIVCMLVIPTAISELLDRQFCVRTKWRSRSFLPRCTLKMVRGADAAYSRAAPTFCAGRW